MTFDSSPERSTLGRGVAIGLVTFGLMACGSESRANPDTAADSGATASSAQDRPAVPPNEMTGIMTAAGFDRPQGDNQWRYSEDDCDLVYAEIEQYQDLNGDGRPDALVKSDSDDCYGMNQRRITLLTQQGGRMANHRRLP